MPVNHLVDGQHVIFRTGAGSKLSSRRRRPEPHQFRGGQLRVWHPLWVERGPQRLRRGGRVGHRDPPTERSRLAVVGNGRRCRALDPHPADLDHRPPYHGHRVRRLTFPGVRRVARIADTDARRAVSPRRGEPPLSRSGTRSGWLCGWLWRRFGGALGEQAGEEHDEHTDSDAAQRPQHPVALGAVVGGLRKVHQDQYSCGDGPAV